MPLTIKVPGKPGSVWTQGSGAPTASANAGDMYYRTDTGDIYQSSGGTSWGSPVGNIQGPTQVSATSGPILPWLENGVRRLFIQYASSVATIDSAGDIILSPNDTQSFRAAADGRIYIGPTTDSPAVNLYRPGTSALQTDASFTASTAQANKYAGTFYNQSATGYGVSIATGGDTYALTATQFGDNYTRFIMSTNGVMQWGTGSVSADTTLYRQSPGTLGTDGNLNVSGGQLRVGTGSGNVGLVSLNQGTGSTVSTGISFQINTVDKWLFYQPGANTAPLYLRDVTNSRMHVTYTPGTTALLSSTQFGTNVVVDGGLTVSGPTTVTGAIAGATNVVPAGGASGQVLAKSSASDYALGWTTPASGGAMAVSTVGSSQTLANLSSYFATASGGAVTLTLPAGVANGRIDVIRVDATANAVTVAPPSGGLLYVNNGTTNAYTLNYPGQQVTFAYSGTDGGWRVLEANTSAPGGGLNPTQTTATSVTAAPGVLYLANPATASTVTLPAISSTTTQAQIGVKNIATTAVTVTVTGSIDGVASASIILPPGYAVTFVADPTSLTWRPITDRPANADPFYVPISGNWYDNRTSAIAALSNLSMALNAAYYVPIYLPRRTPISAIGTNVSTAGTGSSIRFGAFTMDQLTGKPAAIIFDAGTAASTATGITSVAPSGAVLPAGWSFLAAVAAAATTAAQITYCAPGSTAIPFGAGTTQSTTPMPAWTSTTTGGAFAANPVTTLTPNLPLIQYKVA